MEITEKDFLNHTGTNLTKVVRGTDTENAVEILIARAKQRVKDVVNNNSVLIYNEDNYSESQLLSVKNAVLDYLEYMIETGDLYATGGYNIDGSKMPLFPEYIVNNLRSSGVISSSFNRRRYDYL